MTKALAAWGLLALASCAVEDEGWWREGGSAPARGAAKEEKPAETVLGGPANLVAAAIRGMYDAFQARDLASVGKHLAAESTCYDAGTSALRVGRQAVLDHFKGILDRHQPGEKWESKLEDLEIAVSGDIAVAKYKIRTSAGGDHSLAAVTHVFRREGDRWLAVHLHRSWNMAK